MAIIFNKTIPSDKLCLAYNNNILDFTTDSTKDILNCQVTINGTSIVLYPHPNKRFYLNLKQYITTFLNVDNFADDLDVDIFVETKYDWTDKIYLDTDIDIQINFTDLSNETDTLTSKWLSGYLQLSNRQLIPNDELLVLAPQINNEALLKIWNGYPIDFAIYNPDFNLPITFCYEESFEIIGYLETFLVTRFVVSDGFNSSGLAPIEYNFNMIVKSGEIKKFTFHYVQTTPKCNNGFYIKWINSLGGYSYWLFENWDKNQLIKDLGEINNDYNNLEDTLSKSIQIGKTSQNRVNVKTDTINEQEQLLLSDLFDSPKIYWFIGTPNAVNNYNDWTEISLITTSISLEKTKRNLNNITLTFELPANDTRTI